MASTIKLKTYPLPKLYKTLLWLNSSRRRSVLKNWKLLCMILETSGFSFFFNAHFDKLCKNRSEEALFADFVCLVSTVIRSERCAIQKDAVNFFRSCQKKPYNYCQSMKTFWKRFIFDKKLCLTRLIVVYWIKPPELSASLSLVLFSISHDCHQSELFTILLSLILFFASFKSHLIILLVCSTFPPFLEMKSWGEWAIFRLKVLVRKIMTSN